MVMIAMDLPMDASLSTGVHFLQNQSAFYQYSKLKPKVETGFLLYQGSGGSVASFSENAPTGASTKIVKEPQNKLSSAVNEICKIFDITKEELAQACNIQSRKTLYNWINGETTPRKSAMNKMFDLLLTARAWSSSGFVVDRTQLFQPVVNNESIFDMLKNESIDKELVMFAGARLHLASMNSDLLADPFA